MTSFSFDALRRHPDVEAPNLFASDAADRLILDTAGDSDARFGSGQVAVVGDRYGALSLGAVALLGARHVRVQQDRLSGERAIGQNAEACGLEDEISIHDLDEELLSGASTVLMQLPRSLDALDEAAQAIATMAAPDVQIFAGGRVKHMSRTMNDVLARSFGRIDVGRARQKARVLAVADPTDPAEMRWPRSTRRRVHIGQTEREITVWAHGEAFAGPSIDRGTAFLLRNLDRVDQDARDIVDLGCGTGVLATAAALIRPDARITASDQSTAAVSSARLTVDANAVADRVAVTRDDGLGAMRDSSRDVVLLNPPFHVGAAVHTGVAQRLFAEAARVLRPGGQLLSVWNSHLRYRGQLERTVGETEQIARNPTFTVTSSRREG